MSWRVRAEMTRSIVCRSQPAGKPDDQVAHILNAHAARGFEAHQLREQALLRRVVHVDRMLVREVDLHRSHGVVGTGILAEEILRRLVAVPVDRLGRDLLPVRAEDMDIVALQIGRILLHQGNDVPANDRFRRMPIGVEIEIGDLLF